MVTTRCRTDEENWPAISRGYDTHYTHYQYHCLWYYYYILIIISYPSPGNEVFSRMPLYTMRYLPTDLIQTTLIANPINNTSFHNYIIYIRIFTVTMVFKTFIITCKTRELLQYIIIYCCVCIVTHKCYIALAQSR